MTDIDKIAKEYTDRIFDRMEMCRGSSLLKSDIEGEVKTALHELLIGLGRPSEKDAQEYVSGFEPHQPATLEEVELDLCQKSLKTKTVFPVRQIAEVGLKSGTIWLDNEDYDRLRNEFKVDRLIYDNEENSIVSIKPVFDDDGNLIDAISESILFHKDQ